MHVLSKKALALIAVLTLLVSSIAVVGAMQDTPDYSDPAGMNAYVSERFDGKAHDWEIVNMDEVLEDFAWRPQFIDGTATKFSNFDNIAGTTWSADQKIDSYVYGRYKQAWGEWGRVKDSGQIQFQDAPLFVVNPSQNISVLALTFTAPEDGVYQIAPNANKTYVELMMQHELPAEATTSIGFAIHKLSSNAYDSSSSETRVWPEDKAYEVLDKDHTSFEFPTLSGVQLKEGEKLSFVIDGSGCTVMDEDTYYYMVKCYPTVTRTGDLPITYNAKYDSLKLLKDAIAECGADYDLETPFDFTEYAYDLPWQFQYRVDGVTQNFLDESITEFQTAGIAKIYEWGAWAVIDGNTYPSDTIQNDAGQLVHCLNSGYEADSKYPVAALAFVAPEDGLYYFAGNDAFKKFGIWPGQAKKNAVRIWIEADDGTMVWPEDGNPLSLNEELTSVDMPELTVAMKKGAALRFCTNGTTANEDHNNIQLYPMAYNIGEYDQDKDPVKPVADTKPGESTGGNSGESTGGNSGSGTGSSSGESAGSKPAGTTDDNTDTSKDVPDTGDALPVSMAVLALISACAVVLVRRRRTAQ